MRAAGIGCWWAETDIRIGDAIRKPVLVPIRVDDAIATSKTPWAADTQRGRHIGDFVSWRDPMVHSISLQGLLKDLAD